MLIEGVRIRWGVTRAREIHLMVSKHGGGTQMFVPFEPTEGVRERVTEAIDVLVNSDVLPESGRAVALTLSRELFENWGYRWESAS